MNPKKKIEEKKIKFSVSIHPRLFKLMEKDLINKSKLIEKLLNEHYKNM